MTTEVWTDLSPEQVLEAARRFFTRENGIGSAAIEDESEAHITLATFRSRIAVSAVPDPEGGGTRVRVSTLRSDEAIGKFLALVRSERVAGAG